MPFESLLCPPSDFLNHRQPCVHPSRHYVAAPVDRPFPSVIVQSPEHSSPYRQSPAAEAETKRHRPHGPYRSSKLPEWQPARRNGKSLGPWEPVTRKNAMTDDRRRRSSAQPYRKDDDAARQKKSPGRRSKQMLHSGCGRGRGVVMNAIPRSHGGGHQVRAKLSCTSSASGAHISHLAYDERR
ncbi:hypothetical protein BKA80DRAFT_19152 [Phyllosticta citrichinensis]